MWTIQRKLRNRIGGAECIRCEFLPCPLIGCAKCRVSCNVNGRFFRREYDIPFASRPNVVTSSRCACVLSVMLFVWLDRRTHQPKHGYFVRFLPCVTSRYSYRVTHGYEHSSHKPRHGVDGLSNAGQQRTSQGHRIRVRSPVPSAATNAAMADEPMSRARVMVLVVFRRASPRIRWVHDGCRQPPHCRAFPYWKRLSRSNAGRQRHLCRRDCRCEFGTAYRVHISDGGIDGAQHGVGDAGWRCHSYTSSPVSRSE